MLIKIGKIRTAGRKKKKVIESLLYLVSGINTRLALTDFNSLSA